MKTLKKAVLIGVAAIVFVCVIVGMFGGSDDDARPEATAIDVAQVSEPSEIQATAGPTATPQPTETPTRTPEPTGPLLQVHFIDVGQGDAILILAPDGKVALIDGGDSGSGVLQYLRAKGVQRLDLMVATHPHADHIGGLVDVLQALPVDEVVTNGQPHTTRTYERFLDAIAATGAVYTEVKRGDTLQLGVLTFDVIHPRGPTGQNLNDQSIVLRLVHSNVAFLFTGDAERDAETSILSSSQNIQAHVLKIGHHGSQSASSHAFLAAVQPQVSVYSCGAGNSYGHPHSETLAALTGVGSIIYGTDVNGTVVVTSDGSVYKVEVAKQGQPSAPPAVTPKPTEPTSTAEPIALTIEVVYLTSPISPGANASLSIRTVPGAACTIMVYYKSGPSQAAGLGPQNADGNGMAAWQWKVGTRTTPGVWRIVVTATVDGQRTTLEIPFEVG